MISLYNIHRLDFLIKVHHVFFYVQTGKIVLIFTVLITGVLTSP